MPELILISITISTVQSICPSFNPTGLDRSTCLSQETIREGQNKSALLCLRTVMKCTAILNASLAKTAYDCHDASNTMEMSVLRASSRDFGNSSATIEICRKTIEIGYTCHVQFKFATSLVNAVLQYGQKILPKTVSCTCQKLVTFYLAQSPLCRKKQDPIADQWRLLVFYGQIALMGLILIVCLANTLFVNVSLVGFRLFRLSKYWFHFFAVWIKNSLWATF